MFYFLGISGTHGCRRTLSRVPNLLIARGYTPSTHCPYDTESISCHFWRLQEIFIFGQTETCSPKTQTPMRMTSVLGLHPKKQLTRWRPCQDPQKWSARCVSAPEAANLWARHVDTLFTASASLLGCEFAVRALTVAVLWTNWNHRHSSAPRHRRYDGNKYATAFTMTLLCGTENTQFNVMELVLRKQNALANTLRRADASAIPKNGRKLKQAVLTAISQPSDDCAICCDNALGKIWIETRCGHSFHRDCIRAWLRSQKGRRVSCPLCRCQCFPPT